MPKYTPVSNDVTKFTAERKRGYDPKKQPMKPSNMYATPQMKTNGDAVIVNPVTKGDKTSGRGRYERGRMDKSRS